MNEEELNPLTLGETPEEYVENEDGSVDIPEEVEEIEENDDFYVNLAEDISDHDLNIIASDLVELVEKDKESRKKRDQQYEEGIRRTGLGDDAPGGAEFSGASKVVHPVMAEACVDFQSSAIKELFPPSGPVRTDYVGDITREEAARGERKAEFMNWQLTKQMPEYYDELEQLLSQLPLGGAQYMKLRFDEAMRRPVAEFVPVDEILLPYAATSFYTSPRVTHRQLITRYEFEKRVDSGFYRDVDLIDASETPEQSSSALATDKVEGAEDSAYNEDGLREIYEIYTWRDLGEGNDNLVDGETAPYVIHIDAHCEKVLAIYRNWDDQDTSFEKLDWIVEFKFIPWRGAYGVGLPHLIGGLSAALTGALRALLDSAHINNAPTMLKLKSGRIVGQNTQVNVTQVCDIEGPANIDDIKKLAMPMPFNQPSPVLFQLLGFLQEGARGVVSTAEEKIANAGNQMPVGTAMALIEQGSKVFSAIHGRMHRSQAKVLEILHRINAKWLDVEDQSQKLGKVICTPEDFTGSMGIVPASDPNIFSETQRYAQIQALMQMSQDPRVQWNVGEIYQRMLNLMHVSQPEKLLPVVQEPVTDDPMTENNALLTGKPIKTDEFQNHMAHIQGHLACATAPYVLSNPLVPPQQVSALLAHINEHVMLYQAAVTAQLGNQIAAQAQQMGQPVDKEQLAAMASAQSVQVLSQQLQPILQQIGQVQQQLQQRTPPPPMPPEVQATLQIAQMDTQRKTQLDQATIQLKQAELQARQQQDAMAQQLEQAKMSFEQQLQASQSKFEQFIAMQEHESKRRNEELSRQLEILVNEQDNHTHQVTELLKNRDDNETKMLIEQMKAQLDSFAAQAQEAPKESQPDLTPQLQQLTQILDQMGRDQTNNALMEVMNGLRATVEHLGRPKMLIRDAQGKVAGVQ